MRFTAALALLRDGMALMISKGMSPTVDDIHSAVGFAVETADDLIRELDESQEPVKAERAYSEPERTAPVILSEEDVLTQALFDWSSHRIDEPSCRAQAVRYLNGFDVSPLIKTVFDYAMADLKGE